MKNLKKVLAFVVVFAMMFTMAVSASPFDDVDDNASYAEAVTILNALKIMIGDDQGNFNPDKTITRAEATAVIVRAKGLEDAAAGAVGATPFKDVPANHWASGYINIAAQSDIVNGYGDGNFGPEDPVTYDQIVKLIVAALGYTPKAMVNGGYPTGYLVIASQQGITKGATGNAGDPAPRKTVARLIFNALDVNMMEQTVFVKGEERYEEVDKTLLDLLGIDKYEGIVTNSYATKSTVKNDDKSLNMDAYYENGEKYTTPDPVTFDSVGTTNAADFVGYYATVYAKDDEDTNDYTILAIAPKSGRNDIVEIDYTQVDKVKWYGNDIDSVDYVINPTDKNSITLDVADGAYFYYNGKNDDVEAAIDFIDAATDDDSIKPGKIKFVSNGTEGDEYNFVFVTEYNESVVVEDVNYSKQVAYDKDGSTIDIDLEDDNVIYTIYKEDGSIGSFDDIKEGNVLTFARSRNEDVVAVFITDKTVTGTVTESTSDNDTYYRIDGSLYRVGYDNGSPVVSPKVGDEGTFYLNVDNRIVYKEASSTTKNAGSYAYLYDADMDTALGGDKVEFRFVDGTGKWQNAYLASRLTVYTGDDRETIDSAKPGAVVNGIYAIDANGNFTSQQNLFKYQLNSSGEISRIYTVWTNADGTSAYKNDDDNFSLDKSSTDFFKASTKKLGSTFIQDSVVVFSVPKAGEEATDENDITVTTAKAMFSDDNEYTFDMYDIDNDGYPTAIVVKGANTLIDATTRLFVLTSVATGNNENGYDVKKFYGYQEGKSVSAEESEDGIECFDIEGNNFNVDDLAAGDVIIFSLDAAGAIDKIQVIMTADDAESNGFYLIDKEDEYAETYYGRAYEKRSGNRLTLDVAGSAETIQMKGDYTVYEVNVNRTKPVVSVSSYSSIDAAKTVKADKSVDKVLVRIYDDDVIDAVVYTYTTDEAIADPFVGQE